LWGGFRVFRLIAIGFVIVALAFGAWAWLGRGSGGGEGRGGPGGGPGGGRPTFVVTAPVGEAEFAIRIDAVGTAKARESVTVTAKTQDTISSINFRDGDFVRAGHVIVELTSRQQSAQLSEARAALAEAELQFNRTQSLAARGWAARALLDQRRSARDTAAARVRAQESQVADRAVRAPFAGVLGLRQVSLGALVRPGDVITTLDDVSVIKLDLSIPETSMALLSTGMQVDVRAAGFPDKPLAGAVTGIDSRVDPQSRTVAVRAEIANPDGLLKPGMLLSATLRADPRRGLAVAEGAIVPLGPERFVFLAGADGKAERRAVKTGRRNLGQVEILSGLRIGDPVIVDGVVKVRPGAPITLTPPGEGRGERRRGGEGQGRSSSAVQ
jgi:membrane fusion protein, multidrug efflux system